MESVIVDARLWMWWLMLPFLALLLLSQIRYLVSQYRSVGWPTIDAVIQKGSIGFVPIGSGQGKPACFVGYCFRLNGAIYTGLFALYSSSDDVEEANSNFSSGSICVRYNPANPSISYLNNLNDLRFARLTPTQNPQHLAQAPSFDLQEVTRS